MRENINQDLLIHKMIDEIQGIPSIYYKTLYAIIHSFRKNIPDEKQVETKGFSTDNDDFDWDGLTEQIHQNRQVNNHLLHNKIDQLFES